MQTPFLNRQQAAAHLAVKPDTLRRWQKQGKITPVCFIGNRARYRLEDLNQIFNDKISPMKAPPLE